MSNGKPAIEIEDFALASVQLKSGGGKMKIEWQEQIKDEHGTCRIENCSREIFQGLNIDLFEYMQQFKKYVALPQHCENDVEIEIVKVEFIEYAPFSKEYEINIKSKIGVYKGKMSEQSTGIQSPETICQLVGEDSIGLANLIVDIEQNCYLYCIHGETFCGESGEAEIEGEKVSFK